MIVVKIGGDIFSKGLNESLANDFKKTVEQEKLVIVHGGGDEVTSIAEKLGKPQTFIVSPGGVRSRYTDAETVEIFTMVMAGKINKTIVRWLLSKGVKAVGLAGLDAGMLRAERKKKLVIIDERNRKRIIDGGYTGKISKVDTELITYLVEKGFVPVISPVALGEDFEFLNVDADRAAGQIAGALKAERVVFLTDVEGLELKGTLVRNLSINEAEKVLPKIGAGMDKKVLASIEALRAGAKEAIISSGLAVEPISDALSHKNGTVITFE
ncbi:MAG: [LysW]-aminoadipate/[LysW]-glutamate kinase [Candidatus Bathyarchaeia archaeon]